MKVLHIIDSLGLGGAQTVVKGIFEKQKDNKNIYLFSLRKRKINTDINHQNVYIFPSTKKYSFATLNELKEMIIRKKIDMLHCHLFRSQVLGWILKKYYFSDLKLIFHEHGQIFKNNIYYNLFMKASNSNVDSYIAVSKATKNKLIENAKINSGSIFILYNFVDLNKFNTKKFNKNIMKEKSNLGIKDYDFVVGFAARIVERKGWKDFVESAKLLRNKNFCFLIVGDGNDKMELLRFLRKYSLYDVKFLGYKSDMPLFYHLLDCFVIPSHWEPMGITELEAQAIGIPVIASNVEGLNEIIINKKTGLLFKMGSQMDLAKKINFLYSNPNVKNDIIKNSLVNVNRFSFKEYLPKLNKFYLKIYNGK